MSRTLAVTAAAGRAARRFPLPIVAGFVAAASAIFLAEEPDIDWLECALVAASLGISLLTAARLAGERIGGRRGWVADAAGILLLALLWWRWPAWSETVRAFRYTQLFVASHLVVAVVSFIGRPLHRAFWQFNRALLERFLLAATYMAVLYLGLSLALAAVDTLLKVDVADMAYLRLWFVLGFVGSTWIFLAGVPADPHGMEAMDAYPRGLRVFAQYVLVPLLAIYYLIFTLYVVRVLVTWDWPSGWTGYLVSAMATVGILAQLLVAPVDRPVEPWARVFARWFWLAMLPAVVVLWLAIALRVQQYGVTEPRYFLIVLSGWLAAMALFYVLTRSRDYRVIPLSLAIVALLSAAGPWGAYRVSEASQVRRLAGLLTAAGVLADGRIRPDSAALSAADRDEVEAILRYLVERHGTRRLAPWVGDSLVTGPRSSFTARRDAVRGTLRALGVPGEATEPRRLSDRAYVSFADGLVDVAGWRRMARITGTRQTFGELTVVTGSVRQDVRVFRGDVVVLRFPLADVVEQAWAAGQSGNREKGEPVRVVGEGADARGVLLVTSVSVRREDGALRLIEVNGYLLLDRE